MWNSRWVSFNPDAQVTADIRDYTDISNQWLVNHKFPTDNLWTADENFTTAFSASVTQNAAHGGAFDFAAPNPIAYERGEDKFSLGSFSINSNFGSGIASLRLLDPTPLARSFDLSGSYFNGPSDWGIKVSFSPPISMFDNMFSNMFGGMPPVILDLNNDGVRIEPRTGSNVFFNADGDSAIERTSWVGSGDGLLVIDLNGDGKIEAKEMAFANATENPNDTDLEALATLYDGNGDHKLDAADGIWNQLRVWVDADRDAVTDPGELRTLGSLAITSISLISDHNTFTLPDGSRINGFGSFVMDGQTRTLADATLSFESNGFTRTTEQELTIYTSQDNATVKKYYDVANLPGYGDSPGLAINLPGNYAYEGVLGGDKPDRVDIRNATKSMTLYGGAGNDELWSGAANDVIDGGSGSDKLHAGGGDDTIYFDTTDQEVDGGSGYDTGIITASSGAYLINLGAKGLEALISGDSNDTIFANNTGAVVYVDARGGGDTIWSGDFGDMLMGGSGNDEIHGSGGNDLIVGGADHDTLLGDNGDDVLIGGAGSDRIDGGDGNDTATFTGAAADFRRVKFEGHIYVFAANGERDDLTGVEVLRFDDQTIDANTVAESPPINGLEYIASYGDLIANYRNLPNRGEAAKNHYLSSGIPEGRTVSFDGLAYIASYADLINDNRINPTDSAGANHFIDFGYGEGRQVTFKPREYIASYADLIDAYHGDSDSGARHYIMTGSGEGRTVLFKPQSYLDLNPDLKAQFGNNLEAATLDYVQDGYAQNRPWNHAPTVNAPNVTTGFNKTLAASSLIGASDADGHAISYYVRDNTVGGGSGRFWLNGNAMPEGQEFALTAAQFASLQFKSGTAGDSITVHAWDGITASANVTFQVNAVNHAPSVTASNVSRHQGTTVSAASLVAASDADGDALTYSFFDNQIGNNSGRFYLNGVAQIEGDWFGVSAAQLANLTFQVGTSGSDSITVSAHDGTTNGSANFIVTSTNVAPVATASNVSRHQGTTVSAASLFGASDADGDTLTYSFYDNQVGNNSGRFYLNGVAQAEGSWFTVTAAQLANLTFQVGKSGSDSITVSAHDGAAYGSADFTVTATNVAPAVTASNVSRHQGATVSGASLFAASDADGDALSYFVFDNQVGGNSGRFYLNGVAQIEGDWFSVTQAQLANLTFRVGTTGADSITVAANDGAVNGSASFTVTPSNTAPAAAAPNAPVHKNQTVLASTLFGASDADGDALTYSFYDNTVGGSSGHFELDGVAQGEGHWIVFTAAEFARLKFKAGTSGSDAVTGAASDGAATSAVDFVITPTNNPPVVTAPNVSRHQGIAVAAASLFGASDPDNQAITQYSFYDNQVGNGSGRFYLNGVAQVEGTWFGVSAADLANLTFRVGTASSDYITVAAYDGVEYGSANFTVTPTNAAPVISATGVSPSRSHAVSAASLLGVNDPDGDAVSSYWFKDNTVGGGRFELNGVAQAEGSWFGVTPAQFQQLTFKGGAAVGSERSRRRRTHRRRTKRGNVHVQTAVTNATARQRYFNITLGQDFNITLGQDRAKRMSTFAA